MDNSFLLGELEKRIKFCKSCRLCKSARNSVPGEGNPNSEIVFIGEAPGETEDATGRPFVGRAGRLLENLLDQIGYTRDQVWIGNIIKHRPPSNRDPLPDEISACSPFITKQLEIIKPYIIVTLGRFAMNYFYPEGKISRDHGILLSHPKYKVYPVYHPAAALRSSEMFKVLKKDFLEIPNMLVKIKSGALNKSKISKFEVPENEDQQRLFK